MNLDFVTRLKDRHEELTVATSQRPPAPLASKEIRKALSKDGNLSKELCASFDPRRYPCWLMHRPTRFVSDNNEIAYSTNHSQKLQLSWFHSPYSTIDKGSPTLLKFLKTKQEHAKTSLAGTSERFHHQEEVTKPPFCVCRKRGSHLSRNARTNENVALHSPSRLLVKEMQRFA